MGNEIRRLKAPLVELAAGRTPVVAPIKGLGRGGGPNKVIIRAAGQWAARNPGAESRVRDLLDEMDERGHCCLGGGCDLFSPSHWHILGAGFAAWLLCAVRDDSPLLPRVEALWRVETAAMALCNFRLQATQPAEGLRGKPGSLVVLTPGSRGRDMRRVAGKGGGRKLVPVLNDSARSLCCRYLVLGERNPHVGVDTSFNVALPLLQRAQALQPTRPAWTYLQGRRDDLAMLVDRFGWRYEGTPGDYTASFDALPGADNPLWGVRVRDGEVELDWRE